MKLYGVAMMDDFQILHDLFREEALASVERNRIILEERNNQSYTLEISRIPAEIIAFKADMFPDPRGIFQNRRQECKRADYVIVARRNTRINPRLIVYVELKKGGTGGGPSIIRQLRGARCLVAYCRAIVREFWEEDQFLDSYTERFVSVRIGDSESSTRDRHARVHDAPEYMLKLAAPEGTPLQFDKLLGAARR